jgi:transcriptional regulator with XRE-family HTH domain
MPLDFGSQEGNVSIGERLRALRQQRGLSQGDIEKASGLMRSYISRVEHGHTVPSLETLERFAAALGVPLYQLFYEGEKLPPTPHLSYRPTLEELANEPGAEEAEGRFLLKVRQLVAHTKESERSLLLDLASKLADRSKKKAKTPL